MVHSREVDATAGPRGVLRHTAVGAAALSALLLWGGAWGRSAAAEPRGTPSPIFSRFLGGAKIDTVGDVAVDGEGNSYVTGATASANFPVTEGSFQNAHADESSGMSALRGPIRGRPSDAFVTKLDPSGAVVWSTYLGGPNHDQAYAIDVDRDGYVYVAGGAGAGFPVTRGALQTLFRGGNDPAGYGPQDGFVCKIEADGSKLVFCSFFGTPDPSTVRDLAVDASGEIVIASTHTAGRYPAALARAFGNSPRGGSDVVVAKITADGSKLIWATYLGGSGDEGPEVALRLDFAGNPTVLFPTGSSGIATRGAYDTRLGGDRDLFLARLTAYRGDLVWGTYLGGPAEESAAARGLAVGARGSVVVALPTKSRGLPTTARSYQRAPGGGQDIFVARLSSDGSHLLASTFLGGDRSERPTGVAVDREGRVFLAGTTSSENFPVTPDAPRKKPDGRRDAVAAILSPDLRSLRFSTFAGGSDRDFGRAVAVDPTGSRVFLAGETKSHDWPTLGGHRSSFAGGETDIVLWALSLGGPASRAP